LDQSGTYPFPAAVEGYGAQTAKSVTVSNTGIQATGKLAVALSGTNSGSFTLSAGSINSIAVGGTDSFTVVPNTGLAVGTYTATVTVSGGNDISADFTVSFTVNPPLPTFPAYTMKSVPGGTVSTANTGTGDTTNWGAGANSAYKKPYSINACSIGETEITYELWYAVRTWAEGNGYTFANAGSEGSHGTAGEAPTTAKLKPVTEVSWRDAVVWCNAYSEATGKTPAYKYSEAVLRTSTNSNADSAVIDTSANGFRLPSEAQWEYAARGGVPSTGTPWTYDYAGSNTSNDVAVYYTSNTANVKSKNGGTYNGANSLGLYDMSGNVGEWCQDVRTSAAGAFRVNRGGGWDDVAFDCSVAFRGFDARADDWYSSLGFRVVCP
jgi:formylglycine-generating enzyme required for sulfatase activity